MPRGLHEDAEPRRSNGRNAGRVRADPFESDQLEVGSDLQAGQAAAGGSHAAHRGRIFRAPRAQWPGLPLHGARKTIDGRRSSGAPQHHHGALFGGPFPDVAFRRRLAGSASHCDECDGNPKERDARHEHPQEAFLEGAKDPPTTARV
jgi:hypothetical protein